jgi:Tol biopolymer transport system component
MIKKCLWMIIFTLFIAWTPRAWAESWSDADLVFLRNLTGNWNIWTYNLSSHKLQQVTNFAADDDCPVWLQNKTGIAFLRNGNIYRYQNGKEEKLTEKAVYRYLSYDRQNDRLLFSFYYDAAECDIGYYDLKTNREGILFTRPHQQIHPKASFDGKYIYFADSYTPQSIKLQEVYRLVLETNQVETLLKVDPKDFFRPTPSPDGQWLAYISNQSGKTELYITKLDNQDAEKIAQINSSYNEYPAWNREGKMLLYTALINNNLKLAYYDRVSKKSSILDIAGECRDADW